MKINIFIVFSFFSLFTYGQGLNIKGAPLKSIADSLSDRKEYRKAATYYAKETELRVLISYKMIASYYAARSFSLAGRKTKALNYLSDCIKQYGYLNKNEIEEDTAFIPIRTSSTYQELIGFIDKAHAKMRDPGSARIVTSDIDLFWSVYDKYLQDTSDAANLFVSEYFEKGTWALQDYYRVKTIRSISLKGFIRNMATMRKYYKEIRENTQKIKGMTEEFRAIYWKLNSLYPDAIFPFSAFLIGGWSSGGTRTGYGTMVGADMYARDSLTDISELNPWQKANSQYFSNLRYVFSHELIHAQQDKMKNDTTLLCNAIVEGMADFLGELISGKTANDRLHVWAKGKEKMIWDNFKKEMYLNRSYNWIANSNQEKPDHPADQGYWVGYQICKAYYDESKDKKQAVFDMLHIKDYKDFLGKSKYDEKNSN